MALGAGGMSVSGAQLPAYFREAGYRLRPVEPEHVAAAAELPSHHRDPLKRPQG